MFQYPIIISKWRGTSVMTLKQSVCQNDLQQEISNKNQSASRFLGPSNTLKLPRNMRCVKLILFPPRVTILRRISLPNRGLRVWQVGNCFHLGGNFSLMVFLYPFTDGGGLVTDSRERNPKETGYPGWLAV
jgi:hypothetical protein